MPRRGRAKGKGREKRGESRRLVLLSCICVNLRSFVVKPDRPGLALKFFPALKLAVRPKSQTKKMSLRRRGDRLAHPHAAAGAVHAGAKPERHLGTVFQKPFRYRGAILELSRAGRRPQFPHRVIKSVVPDARVPIWLWRGSASWIEHYQNPQEQPGKSANPNGTKALHDYKLPDGKWKSIAGGFRFGVWRFGVFAGAPRSAALSSVYENSSHTALCVSGGGRYGG